MNKLVVKIIVAITLLFLIGLLMFVFIKNGGTGLTNNSPSIQWIIGVVEICVAVIVLLFLPKNIKAYPVKRKWIIGIIIFVIFMIFFFVFFILSALLFHFS